MKVCMLEANSFCFVCNQPLCLRIGYRGKELCFCARIFASWLQFIFSFCGAVLCFQFSLLKLPHSCRAFIHIYDGTHSPDRNNLFLLIHYWNYIQLWNFPSYFLACYSDACAFLISTSAKGKFKIMLDMQISSFCSDTKIASIGTSLCLFMTTCFKGWTLIKIFSLNCPLSGFCSHNFSKLKNWWSNFPLTTSFHSLLCGEIIY